METKIVLRVHGVDLNDFEVMEAIAQHLDDLGWESVGGLVSAILYTDSSDPLAAALDAAHAIEKVLPGSTVSGIDEQLVSIGDMADRLGLSSEAVRLWASGKRRATHRPFPAPHAAVSQGRTMMKLWRWPVVLEWLRTEYRVDPEPGIRYLHEHDNARLNAELTRPTPGTARWQTVTGGGCDRVLHRVDEVLRTATLQRPGGARTRFRLSV